MLAVLHDLNLAARYADIIFLLKQGRLLAKGKSREVLQPSYISEAYQTAIDIISIDDYPFPVLIHSIQTQTFFNTQKINMSWSLQQTTHL